MTCKRGHLPVTLIDSRFNKNGRRRRYQCESCSAKWTTYEVPANVYKRLKSLEKAVLEINVANSSIGMEDNHG